MKMQNWKKNMMAAGVLVVVCAGIYMNWMYSEAKSVGDLTDTLNADKVMGYTDISQQVDQMNNTTSDYFAAVRLSRQQARDSAVELLQEAMAYGSGQEQSSRELEQIVQTALCEAQIESLVIAKGYRDCVAYMSEGGISVAVAAPEGGMKKTDAAVVADIVLSQTDFSMENIRIVEVQ